MKKYILSFLMAGMWLGLPIKEVKAVPVLQIDCSDYGLTTLSKSVTKSYKFFFCVDKESKPSRYYYLGGMRKNNNDYFTLLPITNWGDGYFRAVNKEYSYISMPSCSPNNVLNYCPEYEPDMFYIYQGKKLLDSEVILDITKY